jgi:biopolymer transport protein ExbB/TolQ
MIIQKYKLLMINNINKIIKFIRIILIIIKLFNIEEILNNIFNEILYIYNQDTINQENTNSENQENTNSEKKENTNSENQENTNSEKKENTNSENQENTNSEKKEYNNEINTNVLIIKIIGAVSVVCLLKLSQEQSIYVVISFILVEIIEELTRNNR